MKMRCNYFLRTYLRAQIVSANLRVNIANEIVANKFKLARDTRFDDSANYICGFAELNYHETGSALRC